MNLPSNFTLIATLAQLGWTLIWALTVFATMQSAFYNVRLITLPLENTHQARQALAKASGTYDWVTAVCWAIIIVFWAH